MKRREFIRMSAAGSAMMFIPGIGFVGCVDNDIDALLEPIDPQFCSPVDEIEPRGGFYVEYYRDRKGYRPTGLDLDAWRLDLIQTEGGTTVRETSLTFDDVISAHPTRETSFFQTFQCVGNEPGDFLVSNGYFSGVPLRHYLEDQLGVDWTAAKRVVFRCFDGFSSNHTKARVINDDPTPLYLAYRFDGVSLGAGADGDDGALKHGYPVRIVCPEMMGMKSPKALVQIEVTDVDDPEGYWENRPIRGVGVNWADLPLVKVNSRIFDPVSYQRVSRPRHVIRGTAWSGVTPLAKMEVGVAVIRDGKEGAIEWLEATIEPPSAITIANRPVYDGSDGSDFDTALAKIQGSSVPVPFVWSRWQLEWDVPRGVDLVRLYARATDVDGGVQPTAETGADIADGNNGMHSLLVQIA